MWDDLGAQADDPRRNALRLANPLSDTEPLLRTSLLPGLLATLVRNVGRGTSDLALFESGLVYLPGEGAPQAAPRPGVAGRPSDEVLAQLEALLPAQPLHVAVVLAGQREPAGWWGEGRPAVWADTVQAARTIARAVGVELTVRSAEQAPWHPGRCAALYAVDRRVGEGEQRLVGYAGELHPRVVGTLSLPERTCAMELDLSAMAELAGGPVEVDSLSTYPVATQDVALVVPAEIPVADVEAALRAGAGELLESLRLFDVYVGSQVQAGYRSLAYALRFRAPDRTLTVEEASAARDAAVAQAQARVGAVLRSA